MDDVIISNGEHYLVRYGNPIKLKAVSQNEKIIEFVLRGIPEEQIKRYYESCTGKTTADNEKMLSVLTEIITSLSFTDFENVRQNDKKASETEKIDKEKKEYYQAIPYSF